MVGNVNRWSGDDAVKNLGELFKQAKDMQGRMAQMQEELAQATATGQSGGGMVEVVLNGKQEVQRVRIDPAVVDPADVEMLEDLVAAALNDAQRKIQELAKQSLARMTGGLDIPGLNLPF